MSASTRARTRAGPSARVRRRQTRWLRLGRRATETPVAWGNDFTAPLTARAAPVARLVLIARAPRLRLLLLDALEQVLWRAEDVPREDVVAERVGHHARGRIQLREHRIARRGHVRVHEHREHVDEVDGAAEDACAALRVGIEEGGVEA